MKTVRQHLIILCLFTFAQGQTLEIHIIDVGQGDAVFIQGTSGQTVMYDGGWRGRGASEYLKNLGIEELSLVIASHPDADHIGGLMEIVNNYRPRFFMDNQIPHATQTYVRLLEAVENSGSTYLEPEERRIGLGEANMYIIPPPQNYDFDSNNNSIGFVIEYNGFRMSFTGDAEEEEFNWWLLNGYGEYFEDIDVHRASHHGSRNGDVNTVMNLLYPEVVVISAGKDNRYNHPHLEALNRYEEVGARIYRTDKNGNILIKVKPTGEYRVIANYKPALPFDVYDTLVQNISGVRVLCVLYAPNTEDDNELVLLQATEEVNTQGWYILNDNNEYLALSPQILSEGQMSLAVSSSFWSDSGDTVYLYSALDELVDRFDYLGGSEQACRGGVIN